MGTALPTAGQYNLPLYGDHSGLAAPGAPFYPPHAAYPTGPIQPPHYHLYQPFGPYRQELQPWQRATYDFFMPQNLREDLQKKQFATLQVIPSKSCNVVIAVAVTNPSQTRAFPNLNTGTLLSLWIPVTGKTPLVLGIQVGSIRLKTAVTEDIMPSGGLKVSFNLGSMGWWFCGPSIDCGMMIGYRLTNEKAILNVMKDWKKIKNASIVTIHEVFTTREFGDSSLIFAYDFHPLSKTLQEHHFQPIHGNRYRPPPAVPENTIWGYICQIANALKTIHSNRLAARCLEPSKIILTDNNRIRLSACAILDVVQFGTNSRSVVELQQEDFVKFGKLILSLATGTLPAHLNNIPAALETLGNKYSANLKSAVNWLLDTSSGETKTIEHFMTGIASQMTTFFDLALQDNDEKLFHLAREVENGRIARSLMKLLTILERGDYDGVPSWSETGDRYQLKLFRDYVFHRVDADGKPNLSIGHMLTCMSKLEAGVDENILLTSRDNETVFVLSYRELRQMYDRAFNELVKASKTGAPGANT